MFTVDVKQQYSKSLRLMSGANFPPIVAWNLPATSRFLNLSSQTSVLTGLAFLSSSDELERSSSPGPEVIKLNGPVLAQVLYVSCSISCSTESMKTFSKVL